MILAVNAAANTDTNTIRHTFSFFDISPTHACRSKHFLLSAFIGKLKGLSLLYSINYFSAFFKYFCCDFSEMSAAAKK